MWGSAGTSCLVSVSSRIALSAASLGWKIYEIALDANANADGIVSSLVADTRPQSTLTTDCGCPASLTIAYPPNWPYHCRHTAPLPRPPVPRTGAFTGLSRIVTERKKDAVIGFDAKMRDDDSSKQEPDDADVGSPSLQVRRAGGGWHHRTAALPC